MEKFGVKKEDQVNGLRDQEANLMQKTQMMLQDNEKTAADRAALDNELQEVRNKITELDNGAE